MINGKTIAIDARMIEMSGVGTYIQNLLNKGIYDYAIGDPHLIIKYDESIKIIPFTAPIYGLKEQMFFPNRACKSAGIDLVHFPHYNVPQCYRGDYVVTVHDLTHILFPELLGNRIKYYYARFLMGNALKKAAHVFTDSMNSYGDIFRIFAVDTSVITVTYCGIGKEFCVKESNQIEYLYEKYGIPRGKKLLMYVGNLKPHKNLSRLIEAFSELEDRSNYRLLLVGKAFTSTDLENEEIKYGIRDYVIHTGVVEKEELIDFYNLADLFVFPSLYEGFGLPPLEAMACGTPVVCSSSSSLPEVVGEAAVLVDPTDVKAIKEAIETTINDVFLMNKLRESGRQQCRKFDWLNTVKKVKDTLYECTEK